MIVFDLQCVCGSQFEGWFHDRESFEEQLRQGLVTCVECGSSAVHKILSPVAVHRGSPEAAAAPLPEKMETTRAVAALRKLQTFVINNFDDVGPGLAAEALKIHYGVEKPRNIRGVTTSTEEETLKKEGIELFKIPLPPAEEEPS